MNWKTLSILTALALPAVGFAQDDELNLDDLDLGGDPAPAPDDAGSVDDILSEDAESTSLAQERASLEADADKSNKPAEPEAPREKRVIKTLQKKNFLKIGRYEAGPHVGFVTNDPFINRYLVGGNFAYHVTEIFAVELDGTYSPDFGEADWKPITKQIIEENQVTPDISKIQGYGTASFQFSPIYGKVAVGGTQIINFDIYGTFGPGVVFTADDLIALQKQDDAVAVATANQLHPTLNYGGGMRVIFSEGFAVRVEGRGLSYIEVIEGTQLEMKNNVILQASASFFFPGMD